MKSYALSLESALDSIFVAFPFRKAGAHLSGKCFDRARRQGFTLIEALVALALVLAFAVTLGPFLLQARRIMAHADGRVAAQILLRSLLDTRSDPASLANAAQEGRTEGLRWRVSAQPIEIDALASDPAPTLDQATRKKPEPGWTAYRVTASVSWAPGQVLDAETLRVGKAE
jgi:prepilin-type N-terminal cleavage/methylation domain-containing protein